MHREGPSLDRQSDCEATPLVVNRLLNIVNSVGFMG